MAHIEYRAVLRLAAGLAIAGHLAFVVGVGYLGFRDDERWFQVTNAALVAVVVTLLYCAGLVPLSSARDGERTRPPVLLIAGLCTLAVLPFF